MRQSELIDSYILSQPGAIPTHDDQTCIVAIALKEVTFSFVEQC